MTRAARLPYIFLAAGILPIVGCGVDTSQPEDKPQSATADTTAKALQTLVSKTGVQMVTIPAGEFTMGDDNGEDDERPAHTLRIDAFLMDIHEVTQASYQALMGRNPSKFKNPEHPVEQVGWYGAIRYCNMRSLREDLAPCYDLDTMACNFQADGYRLPTESEWEYACRAGTTTDYSFGEKSGKLTLYAWSQENGAKTTHPVGKKIPNPWGLYDMHGNVLEWCQDYYDETYYAQRSDADPWNSTPTDERVLRGGSWASPSDQCRSSARLAEEPGLADACFGYDAYGFRCVRRSGAGLP